MEEEAGKLRLPQAGEVLGVAEAILGGDKVQVKCVDGNTRLCRIPGKLRKKIWIQVGDLVLVQPWAAEGERKGDVVHVYTPTQASWLKRKGYEMIEL